MRAVDPRLGSDRGTPSAAFGGVLDGEVAGDLLGAAGLEHG
jgi:hypothetical protein